VKGLFRIVVVVLLLLLLAAMPAQAQTPTPDAYSSNVFMAHGGDTLVVASGGTLDIQDGATFTLAETLTQSDGDLIVADDLKIKAQTAIAVTDNSTITPTGTFQPLSAAANTATSSITAGANNEFLILYNSSATYTIVLTDTGTLKLSGNITLGQYDTLTLISDGTNWIQVATSNN
jgi:hypothetical protein